MQGPIDYTVDVAQPVNAALSGFQQGTALRDMRLAQQQKELEAQQRLQMQKDLSALANNPNAGAKDFAAMTLKYPAMSEHFKQSWNILDADQQRVRTSQASQVYAALEAKQPDMARKLLQDQAAAFRNAGDEDRAKQAEVMDKLIETNPDQAKRATGLMLASTMGPDKFESTFSGLATTDRADRKLPGELTEQEAKAQSAATAAKFAESKAVQDLEKGNWDIKKLQNDIDISKENVRIAMLNARIGQERNDLERQKLGLILDKLTQQRDAKVQEKAATVAAGRDNIDNTLNTIERLSSVDDDTLDNMLGPVDSRMLTLRDSTADAEALVEQLGSQTFLSQVGQMKGMGALTETEGKKLQAAAANLSTKQSLRQFKANLGEVKRLMQKARTTLATRYGVPDNVPDVPAAAPDDAELDALLQQYGGQ